MVTVCPSFTLGPPESTYLRDRISIQYILAFLKNRDPKQEVWSADRIGLKHGEHMAVCDVRDVAWVHIKAATSPLAEGRFLVASSYSVSAYDISEVCENATFR